MCTLTPWDWIGAPIFQMRTWRLREVKSHAQGCPAVRRRSQNFNPIPTCMTPVMPCCLLRKEKKSTLELSQSWQVFIPRGWIWFWETGKNLSRPSHSIDNGTGGLKKKKSDYKAGKLFYACLLRNWQKSVSGRLVNKQQRGVEVWLAQGCFGESHALLGALVPACSASRVPFLSLTLLVLRQGPFL